MYMQYVRVATLPFVTDETEASDQIKFNHKIMPILHNTMRQKCTYSILRKTIEGSILNLFRFHCKRYNSLYQNN